MHDIYKSTQTKQLVLKEWEKFFLSTLLFPFSHLKPHILNET